MSRLLFLTAALCGLILAQPALAGHEASLLAPRRAGFDQEQTSRRLLGLFSVLDSLWAPQQAKRISRQSNQQAKAQSLSAQAEAELQAQSTPSPNGACRFIGSYPAVEGEWTIGGSVRGGQGPSSISSSAFTGSLQIGKQDADGFFDALYTLDPITTAESPAGRVPPTLLLCAIYNPTISAMDSRIGSPFDFNHSPTTLMAECAPVAGTGGENGPNMLSARFEFISPSSLCPCTQSTVTGVFIFSPNGGAAGVAKITSGRMDLPYLSEAQLPTTRPFGAAMASDPQQPDDVKVLTEGLETTETDVVITEEFETPSGSAPSIDEASAAQPTEIRGSVFLQPVEDEESTQPTSLTLEDEEDESELLTQDDLFFARDAEATDTVNSFARAEPSAAGGSTAYGFQGGGALGEPGVVTAFQMSP